MVIYMIFYDTIIYNIGKIISFFLYGIDHGFIHLFCLAILTCCDLHGVVNKFISGINFCPIMYKLLFWLLAILQTTVLCFNKTQLFLLSSQNSNKMNQNLIFYTVLCNHIYDPINHLCDLEKCYKWYLICILHTVHLKIFKFGIAKWNKCMEPWSIPYKDKLIILPILHIIIS